MADDTTFTELVSGIPIAMVTTTGPDGPSGRPLAVQRVDDDGTVWFLVDRHADWVTPDLGVAHVSFVDTTTWVSAVGPASTTDDPSTIDRLGDPVTDTWFAEDAEPVALAVLVDRADWWDAPGRVRQAFALVRAKVSGDEPDLGDRGVARP